MLIEVLRQIKENFIGIIGVFIPIMFFIGYFSFRLIIKNF